MTNTYSSENSGHNRFQDHLLNRLQPLSNKKELPPVHSWQPDFCGDIDMRICRDGRWLYNGSEITRPAMVRLFSTVLRRDEEDYYLVTPVEKVRIQVDDAPFVMTSVEVRSGAQGEEYVFTTNVGDEVILSDLHPLWVEEDSVTQEPSPYVRVRDRLDALLHRNVFYHLIHLATERDTDDTTELVITSQHKPYVLGKIKKPS